MKRPPGLPWLVWLAAFLLVEIPAALRKSGTLSAAVWTWFRGPLRRSVLGAFMVTLTAHFVWQASPWWLLSAVPVAATIVDAVAWGGRNAMLFEKQVKRLAIKLGLRWLGAKVAGARESGSEAMKALDGWKTWISAVVWIGVAFWALLSGQDLTPIAQGIAEALKWETPTGENVILYAMVANTLFAIWGVAGKVMKARAQAKAGATAGELLGPIGVIKAAVADGTLTAAGRDPVVLNMTDKAPTEAKAAPIVAVMIAEPSPVSVVPSKPAPLPVR